jgi:hypothetical protein
VNSDVRHVVGCAFENAIRALTYSAIRSPQAVFYLEILTSLSAAIAKKRSKVDSVHVNRHVSRLFTSELLEPDISIFAHDATGDFCSPSELIKGRTPIELTNGSACVDDLSEWADDTQSDQEMFSTNVTQRGDAL